MRTATPLRVLLAGDVHAAELVPAVKWLRAHARCEATPISQRFEPEAVVLCQSRPGQFTRAFVEDLYRLYPLSRLLALLGPWCEGEVRSGKPWQGVTRIYWHQWPSRLPREIGLLAAAGTERLPRTATEVDLLVSRPAPARRERPALIGVATQRQSDFEAVALALDAGGHHAIWLPPGHQGIVLNVDVLLIDGERLETRRQFGSPPAILLADFPRREEVVAASSSHGCETLAKPYSIDDLLARVGDLIATAVIAAPAHTSAA